MGYTNDGRSGWKDVYEHIRSRIESGELKPEAKLPTEAQLIQMLGVSKMTVHRALRELASQGLVKRIERVGTFVAGSAEPSAKKTGLFLPTNEGFLEIKYLSGIREALGDRQIMLYATDNDPVIEAELLNQAVNEVDGILILPTCHRRISKRLQQLNDNGCPVVCIDREPNSVSLAAVTTNCYDATRQGLQHLGDAGHKRIAYFGLFSSEMSSLIDRHRAFRDFVNENQMGNVAELTRFIEPRPSEELDVEWHIFADAMLRFMTDDEPVTAAFCANEHYLSVLLEVCQSLPKPFQDRFEIVSFCDWPSLSFPTVKTHLIRQDARCIGYAAASRLIQALETGVPPQGRTEVPATFEVSSRRASTSLRMETNRNVFPPFTAS